MSKNNTRNERLTADMIILTNDEIARLDSLGGCEELVDGDDLHSLCEQAREANRLRTLLKDLVDFHVDDDTLDNHWSGDVHLATRITLQERSNEAWHRATDAVGVQDEKRFLEDLEPWIQNTEGK